ncbi:hypothetical protein L6654_29425 [Bradyrhizobium sp. WYCCWR 13023]|uniref:Uncharacterized protein n=1 Tax=Bradyrhizobium zhengyangense TaxID=2911009 RepID=A0A9X1RF42_9BRAD|nr:MULTISPECIES: hypothetical protein [Bradyrhizobium]MCG2630761.1 hypothetical protein [Bradyrhizobium zhengyangense]MCG2643060.1 hypothetical protein [Bradyrhizobium zhengyangense]MCG2671653.1 hypothetical protein [Bradyrhizobium zhengyangense]MDA9519204.1 hypothetical protein [Bradyrhizobium sp. CCBAU 11434]
MHRFVAKANVDHFIGLLSSSDLTPNKRRDITALLVAELHKLAHDLEHLDFAEKKVAEGREKVSGVRSMRNSHRFGTTERQQAEDLLVAHENLQTVLEDFCHRLRVKVVGRPL